MGGNLPAAGMLEGGRRARVSGVRREQGSGLTLSARVAELRATRQDVADRAAASERLIWAQRQMTTSQAAARTAITNSLRAFRTAAQAHERAALQHERAAAAGRGGNRSTTGKQQATGQPPQPLDSEPNASDRCFQMTRVTTRTDQAQTKASNWPVILTARGIADLFVQGREPIAPRCCTLNRRRAFPDIPW